MSYPRLEYRAMEKMEFTQIELITPCPHAAGIITRSRLTRNCGGVRTGCAVFTIEPEGSG